MCFTDHLETKATITKAKTEAAIDENGNFIKLYSLPFHKDGSLQMERVLCDGEIKSLNISFLFQVQSHFN